MAGPRLKLFGRPQEIARELPGQGPRDVINGHQTPGRSRPVADPPAGTLHLDDHGCPSAERLPGGRWMIGTLRGDVDQACLPRVILPA